MHTRLYVVRHGQTQFNIEGKRQGHLDSPLTGLGRKQAEAVRDWFKEQEIQLDKAYTSDLGRAVDTCRIITEDRIPAYATSQLREVSFGKLDGTRIPFPGIKEWEAGAAHEYGGETYLEAWERTIRCLLQIGQANPGQNVLVVAHSALMVMMDSFLDTLNGYEHPEGLSNGTVLKMLFSSGRLWLEDCYRPAEGVKTETRRV